MTNTAAAITNVWGWTVEYRARSVDENSVTSEWESATLTVLPSAISASLSFAPTSVVRGVSSTLTAVPGTWGPGGVSYGYRWYRGSTAIKGATGKTYKVTKKDRGAKLRVVVRGTKTGYVTVEKRASVRIAK